MARKNIDSVFRDPRKSTAPLTPHKEPHHQLIGDMTKKMMKYMSDMLTPTRSKRKV